MTKIRNTRLKVQLIMFVILVFGGIFGLTLTPILLPIFVHYENTWRTCTCVFGVLERNISLEWRLEYVFPFATLGSLLLIPLIFGRALCGWACPLGLLSDLFSRLRQLLKVRELRFSRRIHEKLSDVKYGLCFFLLLTVISIGVVKLLDINVGTSYEASLPLTRNCPICPANALIFILPDIVSMWLGIGPYVDITPLTPALVMGVFFIVASFTVSHFWCKYICPLSPLISWANKYSLLHVNKDLEKCNRCGVCIRCCPMGSRTPLEEEQSQRATGTDCIFCLCCIENCPENALEARMGRFKLLTGKN